MQTAEQRLSESLDAAGLAFDGVSVSTAAIASPLRLATEWAGFTLIHDGRACHAKVLFDDMRPLIDPARSAEASFNAARAGAAPQLLHADAERGVLLFEALPAPDWKWARVDQLSAPDRLERLLGLKRQVHQGPRTGFARSPGEDLARLRQLCHEHGVLLPDDAPWIDQCVDMAVRAIAAAGWDSRSLHGDGVASNVLLDAEGQMRLVDFDYGGAFDPWFDVATTLNELYPFEDQWRQGLEIWAGVCREADYARCRLHALIDDWHWTLWGLWAGTRSARNVEFSKVGQWTLLRTREALRDHRFENWLRQV
ncbi:phosphotransferase family protein [Stutzerimonas tarimensis]|uniref:Phosphotransferase family protein n=1 Tax=Stutzerimonas tarimensis TaxID=1507735 RepID=A0ABV7T9A4_9GAMM